MAPAKPYWGGEAVTSGPAADGTPVWSPDGERMAFTRNSNLYVMDSDGRNIAALTEGSRTSGLPSWSPDGEEIAFTSARDGDWDIYVMDADESDAENVTKNAGVDDVLPSWSPDGKSIAFATARNGNWDIYVKDLATDAETRLTASPRDDMDPAWSPDGRTILFWRDIRS